jgi:hypothetical protein
MPPVVQPPDSTSGVLPPLYWPAGHERLQCVAPASLPVPAGHVSQFEPLDLDHDAYDVEPCAANFPAGHATHKAAAALVLPSGPHLPAGHLSPWQVERAAAVVAYVPLVHGTQGLQRHLRLAPHARAEALFVLK